jgi:DNA-binding LytR/AlgR family response regulator
MKKIAIPDKQTTYLFNPEEIICLKASGAYTQVYVISPETTNGWRQIISSRHIGYFETLLTNLNFQRVCKNIIIALHHITAINKNNTIILRYSCCAVIPLSKKYRNILKQRILLTATILLQLLPNLQQLLPQP